jgi:hypothetical protein
MTQENERERLQAEEAARIEREQAAELAKQDEMAAAQRALDAVAEAKRAGAIEPELAEILGGLVASLAADGVIELASCATCGKHSAPAAPAIRPDTQPTMPLGQINERLGGLMVSADLLDRLGFPFTRDKASKLYHAEDFPRICAALAEHALKCKETG